MWSLTRTNVLAASSSTASTSIPRAPDAPDEYYIDAIVYSSLSGKKIKYGRSGRAEIAEVLTQLRIEGNNCMEIMNVGVSSVTGCSRWKCGVVLKKAPGKSVSGWKVVLHIAHKWDFLRFGVITAFGRYHQHQPITLVQPPQMSARYFFISTFSEF